MPKRTRSAARRGRKTAAKVGVAMGHFASRVARLRRERAAISGELRDVITRAERLMSEMEDEPRSAGSAGRRADQTGGAAAPRRKRRLSPEGRARIAAAARKRWARHRREKG